MIKRAIKRFLNYLKVSTQQKKIIVGQPNSQIFASYRLNNGISIPSLGFGTFKLNESNQCEKAVYEAIRAGYRLVDTAAAYENEIYVGRAIKHAIDDGLVKRKDIFLCTKIWVQDFGDVKTMEALNRALNRLQTDYLDMCLLHYPFGDVYGAWRALEKAVEEGVVRSIGVSNFPDDILMDLILHCKIIPAINQIETNPYIQQINSQVFLGEQGVLLEAWSPFATGNNNIWKHPVLNCIARRHNATVSQVILRWLLQRGVAVISKASSVEHIRQNLDVFNLQLSKFEMWEISKINKECSVYFGKEGVRNPMLVEKLGRTKFIT